MSDPRRPIPVSVGQGDPRTPPVPDDAPLGRRIQAPEPLPLVQTPPIDIHEDADGLVLEADVPGATEQTVSIHLQDNVLSLRADARTTIPGGAKPLRLEYPIGSFQRTFILSDEVDRSRISAELKWGVLRLILPRAERARPRRIEIKGQDG